MNTECFLCGNPAKMFFLRKNDFTLYRCPICGVVTVEPPPSKQQLDKYYEEGYQQFQYSFQTPLKDPSLRDRNQLRTLERYCTKGRLLDIGAAYGHFMHCAQKRGWQVTGVEPQNEARILAQSRFRLTLLDHLSKAPAHGFDVVTLWHVIEHLPDPQGFLGEVRTKLAANGMLALTTPNIRSLSAMLTGASWGWLSPPDHVIIYTTDALKRLVEKNGFDVVYTDTRRGAGKNILLMGLQGIAFRLGLFGRLRRSVRRSVSDYQHKQIIHKRLSFFLLLDRVTEAATILLLPVLFVLWKLGLGDEIYLIARKRNNL